MIIEIALGIVLAVVILTCWPLILAGGLALIGGGIALAAVIWLGILAIENPDRALAFGAVLSVFLAYGVLSAWLSARLRVDIDSIVVLLVCVSLTLMAAYGLVDALIDRDNNEYSLFTAGILVFCGILAIVSARQVWRQRKPLPPESTPPQSDAKT